MGPLTLAALLAAMILVAPVLMLIDCLFVRHDRPGDPVDRDDLAVGDPRTRGQGSWTRNVPRRWTPGDER